MGTTTEGGIRNPTLTPSGVAPLLRWPDGETSGLEQKYYGDEDDDKESNNIQKTDY